MRLAYEVVPGHVDCDDMVQTLALFLQPQPQWVTLNLIFRREGELIKMEQIRPVPESWPMMFVESSCGLCRGALGGFRETHRGKFACGGDLTITTRSQREPDHGRDKDRKNLPQLKG
jgi:hypothetical protein